MAEYIINNKNLVKLNIDNNEITEIGALKIILAAEIREFKIKIHLKNNNTTSKSIKNTDFVNDELRKSTMILSNNTIIM